MYSFTDFVLILTVITNDITEKEISVLIPYEQIKNDQDLSFWVRFCLICCNKRWWLVMSIYVACKLGYCSNI